MTNTRNRYRVLLALPLAAVLGCAVAACGSSSGGSSAAGSASASTTSKFTGSPVVIYTASLLQNALGNYPEIPAGVNAAVRSINAKGGLDGHEIKVKTCDIADANSETTCVRNAIQDKAIAFVGALLPFNGPADYVLLDKAKIPSIAGVSVTPSDYSSPMGYFIMGQPLQVSACLKLMPTATGKSGQALVSSDIPALREQGAALQAQAPKLGADIKTSIYIPSTQTDYSTTVQQLTSAGADIAALNLATPSVTALVSAASGVGKSFDYCEGAVAVSSKLLISLGTAVDGKFFAVSSFPASSDTSKYPILGQYRSEMAAEQAAGDSGADLNNAVEADALNGWLGVQVLKQASASVSGALTNTSLVAALSTAKINLGGVMPTLDFGTASSVAGYSRLFNPNLNLLKWDASKKEFVSTSVPPTTAGALVG